MTKVRSTAKPHHHRHRFTKGLGLAIVLLAVTALACERDKQIDHGLAIDLKATQYTVRVFFSGAVAVLDGKGDATRLLLLDDQMDPSDPCHHAASLSFPNDLSAPVVDLVSSAQVSIEGDAPAPGSRRTRLLGRRPTNAAAPLTTSQMEDASWLSDHRTFFARIYELKSDLSGLLHAEATFQKATLSTCMPVTYSDNLSTPTLDLHPEILETRGASGFGQTQTLAALQVLEMDYSKLDLSPPNIHVQVDDGTTKKYNLPWSCDGGQCTAEVLLSNIPQPSCNAHPHVAEHFVHYYDLYAGQGGTPVPDSAKVTPHRAGRTGLVPLRDIVPARCQTAALQGDPYVRLSPSEQSSSGEDGAPEEDSGPVIHKAVPINRVMCPLWG